MGQSIPYGLVLVSNETWFDEGICFCGAIALKTFVPAEGTLLELSQLANGEIKKIQVISETHRAILFEWTHSVITQRAYARIGASLRLKPASHRAIDNWIALSKEKRSGEAGTGWLRPGITKADLLRAEKLSASPPPFHPGRLGRGEGVRGRIW